MRALLTTIGSRGDVQPLVALALELRARGHEARVCAPPDFTAWVESFGIAATPLGPSVRAFAAARPAATERPAPLTAEQRQQMAAGTVATQFDTLMPASEGCDIVVAATALQVAARSVAEVRRVPYLFVAYTPAVIPSDHHAPPPLPPMPGQVVPEPTDNRERWARDAVRFHSLFGDALNAQRAARGLAPVDDVRRYMFTETPWLAADPTLGPWPDLGSGVVQTGAWILRDERPLPSEVDAFLSAGPPPIYFGFGSTRATADIGRMMLEAVRRTGSRAVVSRGWFESPLVEEGHDCLTIDEVNVRALFPRVAGAVHHGGAGTTLAAAVAGVPQIVVPQQYDQHYWAAQVERLGVGTRLAASALSAGAFDAALAQVLTPVVRAQARAIAPLVRLDGVARAVHLLEAAVR